MKKLLMAASALIGMLAGLLTPPTAWAAMPMVSAGAYHTCAMTNAGSVFCWGYNAMGQLGNANTTDSTTPVAVPGLGGIVAIAAGSNHTCALDSVGAVKCWGSNAYGQLGNGNTTDSTTPVAVTGLASSVRSIAAGYGHTCAVTSAGAVQCWGWNGLGQLGNGNITDSHTPVLVSGLTTGVVSTTAAYSHSCALTSGGAVKCWGNNGSGQLGNGTFTNSYIPVQVVGLSSGVLVISSSHDGLHTCVQTSGGAVQCWGSNTYGQLGNGNTTDANAPVAVPSLSNGVQAIAAGHLHTCALASASGVECWGYNIFGQLGNGTTINSLNPVTAKGLTSAVAGIAAGYAHTCAVTRAGAVECWGSNNPGQLGNGTITDFNTAVAALGAGGSGLLNLGASATRFDLDGDGKADVLWRNATSGQSYGWLISGLNVGTQGFLPTIADPNWQVAGIGDVNGDGRADVIWRKTDTGENYVWLMNGLTTNSSGYLPTVSTDWKVEGVADMDGDGRADILWRNTITGENYLWLMNGLSISGGGYLPTIADQNWQIQGVADMNGDGKSDVLWRNSTSGENYVWLMNGLSSSGGGYLPTIADQNWQVEGLGDLDGDGRADILWRNTSTGEDYGWLLNGLTVIAEGYLPQVPTDWVVASFADTDGDGKLDLVWRNTTTGDTYGWLMNGLSIKTSGYLPTVADSNWKVQR